LLRVGYEEFELCTTLATTHIPGEIEYELFPRNKASPPPGDRRSHGLMKKSTASPAAIANQMLNPSEAHERRRGKGVGNAKPKIESVLMRQFPTVTPRPHPSALGL
jgi:hypothetical protein